MAPYIYSDGRDRRADGRSSEVDAAVARGDYETLIGLMATTGLRLGEALGLDRPDVDLEDGVLHVRRAKQDKQREVPLHASTTAALASTLACGTAAGLSRDAGVLRLQPGERLDHIGGPLHVPEADPRGRPRGTRATATATPARSQTSLCGADAAGLASRRRRGRTGSAAALHLPRARRPSSSYWYPQAVPELLALVGQRLDGVFGDKP